MSRPPLSSLPFTKKTLAPAAAESPLPEPIETAAPAERPAPRARQKPDEKVVLMVRVSRADRKKIRQIAIASDTTVQALVEEAVKDIVRRHRVRSVS